VPRADFTATGHTQYGGLVVQAERGTPVTLPADYVAKHVQLGYAVTAHRAQGSTVDTARVIAAPGMTREAFYVAMTRGRYANHAHVITNREADTDQPAAQTASAQVVLAQILANPGQQLSAHDTRTELEHQAQQWTSRRHAEAERPPAVAIRAPQPVQPAIRPAHGSRNINPVDTRHTDAQRLPTHEVTR
jgi:hypothetical protein